MAESENIIEYYNQDFVKNAIVELAEGKEAVGSYNNKGFAKRPEMIQYPQDVVEFAKKGITSFHISEETWSNPLLLQTGLRKKELDSLRDGWDLILDIDCPEFEFSRIAAELIIELLRYLVDESCITAKFSGNHGFHIAIPFEAFPTEVNGINIKDLFPESPRKIALYLTHEINDLLIQEFQTRLGKNYLEIISQKIKKPINKFAKNNTILVDEILEIDTVLISSRHLFRSVFSINEKSGLVSIPVDIHKIKDFQKTDAEISNVIKNEKQFENIKFMNRNVEKDLAKNLFIKAYDYNAAEENNVYKDVLEEKKNFEKSSMNNQFEDDSGEILPQESFPPCILCGLNGLKDGRKRFAFILRNFLTYCNWPKEEYAKLFNKWNDFNLEKLRQTDIDVQLRYMTKQVLPPNCDRKEYYQDLMICHPDGLCKKIKNPVAYAKKKAFFIRKEQEDAEKQALKDKKKQEKEEARRLKLEKLKKTNTN
ncbi:hypothetical protein JXM83_06435 [Candidatus Woesearchaeota archaeon]|nr:hypothetical protein [Candidatus Woesearchaeota archaeon]